MKKRIFLAAIMCVFMGVLFLHCHNRTLSSNEAGELLEAYLTRQGRMEREDEEGVDLELEFNLRPRGPELKIEGKPAYFFTLWALYEQYDEEVRAGSLSRDSYWAITKDGSKIYEMDLATDEWIEIDVCIDDESNWQNRV